MNAKLELLLSEFEPGDLVAASEFVGQIEGALDEAADSGNSKVLTELGQLRNAVLGTVRGEPGAEVRVAAFRHAIELASDARALIDAEEECGLESGLASMVSTIVDLLIQFDGIDVLAATTILAAARELAIDPDTPVQLSPCIRRLQDAFQKFVKSTQADTSADDVPPDPVATRAAEPSVVPVLEDGEEPREVHVEDPEMILSFLGEASDHLNDIESRILRLESDPSDELVNHIFRSMHTIKGVAGFLGFRHVGTLTHELETLLDAIRDHRLEASETTVTVLLDGTDVLTRIISSVEEQCAGGVPSVLVEYSFGHAHAARSAHAIHAGVSAAEPLVPRPSNALPAGVAPPSGAKASTNELVTPEMVEAFTAETSDMLDDVEQTLLATEAGPLTGERIDQVFRAIHTIKGNSGFFWFAEIEQECMRIESDLEPFRSRRRPMDAAAAERFLAGVDRLRGLAAGRAVPGSTSGAPVYAQSNVGEILVEMGDLSPAALEEALRRQRKRVGEILVEEGTVGPDSVSRALEEQTRRRSGREVISGDYSVARKDIRVDTVKLDKLFELMGELITAESMLLGNEELQRSASAGLEKAMSYLQKVTREMQEITMTIRMIPLDGIFGKMRRLVRDLSRRFSKDVSIVVHGEETEMDKNVIEEISDPLIHIIRNSIDHGIEPADARTEAGKSAAGTITLSARHEGNEIWITVEDDGKGLDRERIVRKAIERGLLPDDQAAAAMSDDQVWQFILEPAFSTAEQVSEISGRGVGMDVVKKNIEKLRGRIDLWSASGQGTRIVLRIPLTLAILEGVTVANGGTHYSIPTDDLVTFQRLDLHHLVQIDTVRRGFRFREEVVPILSFHGGSDALAGAADDLDRVIIILQSNNRRAAVLADEVIGYRQFVVRSLPSYVQNMRAISGCSVQGDGNISFIIDVAELFAQELVHVGTR